VAAGSVQVGSQVRPVDRQFILSGLAIYLRMEVSDAFAGLTVPTRVPLTSTLRDASSMTRRLPEGTFVRADFSDLPCALKIFTAWNWTACRAGFSTEVCAWLCPGIESRSEPTVTARANAAPKGTLIFVLVPYSLRFHFL